jgi:PadR family transcriptional regulator, regulatory protein AphA
MSSDQLTPFSYAVLALVGTGGAGAHDLVQMMRRGRVYWAAAESHWYAEPKRLARLEYLSARQEPGKTRERTVYELTDRGRSALRDWIGLPASFPRIQHEAVVKLLAADLADDATVVGALQGLRAEAADLAASLEVAEAIASTLPHRERYLLLVHDLGRRLVQTHLDWLTSVEEELLGTARR